MENTNPPFYNKNFWCYFALIFILTIGIFLVKQYPKTFDNSLKNKHYLNHRFTKVAKYFPDRIGNLSLVNYDILAGIETVLITHSTKHPQVIYTVLFVLLPFFIFNTFTASYLLHIFFFSFSFAFGLRTLRLITKKAIYPLIMFILFTLILNNGNYLRPQLLMVDHFFAYCLLIILSLFLGAYHKVLNLTSKKNLFLLGFSLFGLFVSRNGGYLFYIPSFAFLFFLLPSKKQFHNLILTLLICCITSSLAVNIFVYDTKKIDINLRLYALHLALKVYQEDPNYFSKTKQGYLKEAMKKYRVDNLDCGWDDVRNKNNKKWINDRSTIPLIIKLWFHFPLTSVKEAFDHNYSLWSFSSRGLITQTIIPLKNPNSPYFYIKMPLFNYVAFYFWLLLLMISLLTLFYKIRTPFFSLLFFLPFTAIMAILVPIPTTRYFYYFQFCGAFLVSYFIFLFKNDQNILKRIGKKN